MNFILRVDSSTQIGTGHIMRCLTLASHLREQSHNIDFISRSLPGNLCDLVEKKGFDIYRLPYQDSQCNQPLNPKRHDSWLGVTWENDLVETRDILIEKLEKQYLIHWLIIDHYALDWRWQSKIRSYVNNIMVIDDLADRSHNCDLLLDQNLHETQNSRYDQLVPEHCQKLLGIKYVLLRPEFAKIRETLQSRKGIINRILVFFGGCDPTNQTTKALTAIQLLQRPDIMIDVVVGAANPHIDNIKKLCEAMPNTNFYCQIENMVELMSKANLAIGAAGSTSWERICMELPTLIFILAENQKLGADKLAGLGVAINLGWYEEVSIEKLVQEIKKLITNHEIVAAMSYKCHNLVDGKGTSRVVNFIQQIK